VTCRRENGEYSKLPIFSRCSDWIPSYCSMDYIYLSSLVSIILLSIIISYNITCQWSKNFFNQLKAMPPWLQFKQLPSFQFKMPKFHLPAHKADCHSQFSFNYTPGVGCTDGEGVKRNWLWLNGAAASTSQMGPGSQSNTLDNFMGFSNYCKVTNFSQLECLIHLTIY